MKPEDRVESCQRNVRHVSHQSVIGTRIELTEASSTPAVHIIVKILGGCESIALVFAAFFEREKALCSKILKILHGDHTVEGISQACRHVTKVLVRILVELQVPCGVPFVVAKVLFHEAIVLRSVDPRFINAPGSWMSACCSALVKLSVVSYNQDISPVDSLGYGSRRPCLGCGWA